MALSLREKPIFQTKNSLMTLFLLSSHFRTHPITLLLEILGNGCMGRSPPQILRDRPPVPLSLRLCSLASFFTMTLFPHNNSSLQLNSIPTLASFPSLFPALTQN